jgi:hypothetical protein
MVGGLAAGRRVGAVCRTVFSCGLRRISGIAPIGGLSCERLQAWRWDPAATAEQSKLGGNFGRGVLSVA